MNARWTVAPSVLVVVLLARPAGAQTGTFVRPGLHPTVQAGLLPGVQIDDSLPAEINGDGRMDLLATASDASGIRALLAAVHEATGWMVYELLDEPPSGSTILHWEPPITVAGQRLIVVTGTRDAPEPGTDASWAAFYVIAPGHTPVAVGHLGDSSTESTVSARGACVSLTGRRSHSLCWDASRATLVPAPR